MREKETETEIDILPVFLFDWKPRQIVRRTERGRYSERYTDEDDVVDDCLCCSAKISSNLRTIRSCPPTTNAAINVYSIPYLSLTYITIPYITLQYLTLYSTPYINLPPYLTSCYIRLPYYIVYLTWPYNTIPYYTLLWPSLPYLT